MDARPSFDRHHTPVYLIKRRRARIALFVCLLLLFAGYAYLSFLEAYLAPLLVGAEDRLYLLYASHAAREPEPSFTLRERGREARWKEERRFQGDFRAAAGAGDELWVFYRRSCSVYRDGVQVRALAVDFGWDVQAAIADAPGPSGSGTRTFLVFGFDEKHVLRGERLTVAGGGPLAWEAMPATLPRSSSPRRLYAVPHGGGILLAWPRNALMPEPAPLAGDPPAEGEGPDPWSLQACFLDGSRFAPLPPLPLGETQACTLFPVEGSAVLVTVPVEHKEVGRLRLASRRFTGAGWGEPTDFRILDGRWWLGRRVLDLTGCAQGGRAHLVVSRAAGLETASAGLEGLQQGEFPRLEPVSPTASFGRPEVFVWLSSLLFLALLLVFLGVSLLTERFRPSPPAGAVAIELATWVQRGLAWGVDVCVLSPVVLLLLWVIGYEPDTAGEVAGGPIMLLTALWDVAIVIYTTVLESRSGQTVGKWLLRIHVLTEEGGRPTFRQALLRNLVRPIDGAGPQALLGLLFIFATRRSQRLGDILARTVVARHGPGWTA